MKFVNYIVKGKVRSISIDDLKKLKTQLTDAWESACKQCGKCCFEKSLKNGVWLINYSRPCQFLKFEGEKARCKVYADRFDKVGRCNTIPEAIQKSYLPESCPYVKSVPSYKAPIDNHGWYRRAKGKLLKEGGILLAPPGVMGTTTMPAEGPNRATGGLTREDLKAKIKQLRERKKEHQALSTGKAGTSDAKIKNPDMFKKPSGHALGG